MDELLNELEALLAILQERRVDDEWPEIAAKIERLKTLSYGQRLLNSAPPE